MVGKAPTQFPASEQDWRALLEIAVQNGVVTLCHHQMTDITIKEQCPDWFCADLKKYTHQLAVSELIQSHELEQVLTEFAQAEIFPILMKGAPLSYTLYPKPYLRERCDTDMLFSDRKQANAARDLLLKRGYQQPNAVSGDFVSHQFACYRTTGTGIVHSLDMHWHLNNDHFFASAFSFDEFVQQTIPIPGLGENARTLEPVHALLLACMHRVGHLKDGTGERLVWLYDIHLLAGQFSEKQWKVFEELTLDRKLESVCLDSMEASRKAFKTRIPENILHVLRAGSNKSSYAPPKSQTNLAGPVIDLGLTSRMAGNHSTMHSAVLPSNFSGTRQHTRTFHQGSGICTVAGETVWLIVRTSIA